MHKSAVMAFFYTARDESGRRTGGVVLARSRRDVLRELLEKKVYVESLRPLPAPFAFLGRCFFGGALRFKRRKLKGRELALFSRQLSAMLGAGVPLLKSLDVLHRQAGKGALGAALAEIAFEISKGTGLAAAVRKTGAFPPLFSGLVEVGEAGGLLDEVMEGLACHYERELHLKEKLKSALYYPAFVAAVALLAAAVTVLGVLPAFGSVLSGLGVEMPLAGRVVMGAAKAIYAVWPACAAACFVILPGLRLAAGTPAGKKLFDTVTLKVPLAGAVWKKVLAARFCRTLGMLLKSGVPLLPALAVVRAACGSTVFSSVIEGLENRVSEGRALAGLLVGSGFFSPLAVQLVSAGEEAGNLEEMLGRAAAYYESEVEAAVRRLSSLAEPLTVALAGLLVGLVVFSVMLPLFNLVASLE